MFRDYVCKRIEGGPAPFVFGLDQNMLIAGERIGAVQELTEEFIEKVLSKNGMVRIITSGDRHRAICEKYKGVYLKPAPSDLTGSYIFGGIWNEDVARFHAIALCYMMSFVDKPFNGLMAEAIQHTIENAWDTFGKKASLTDLMASSALVAGSIGKDSPAWESVWEVVDVFKSWRHAGIGFWFEEERLPDERLVVIDVEYLEGHAHIYRNFMISLLWRLTWENWGDEKAQKILFLEDVWKIRSQFFNVHADLLVEIVEHLMTTRDNSKDSVICTTYGLSAYQNSYMLDRTIRAHAPRTLLLKSSHHGTERSMLHHSIPDAAIAALGASHELSFLVDDVTMKAPFKVEKAPKEPLGQKVISDIMKKMPVLLEKEIIVAGQQ